ncbi:MAG: hypothetical protein NVS2B16_35390 [Chloroflexota bacterium]
MDLMLDLLVAPNRVWAWKDEDEFDALVSAGIIGAGEAARVWEEAGAVAHRVEVNEWPFSEPWHEWRPDPTWRPPELPPGWEAL